MSNNRDDEPAYIFCNAETKEELAKRSGENMPPDEVFVVADVVLPGTCIVVTKEELRQWLFDKGNGYGLENGVDYRFDPISTILALPEKEVEK